jgi:hypothetical protein
VPARQSSDFDLRTKKVVADAMSVLHELKQQSTRVGRYLR